MPVRKRALPKRFQKGLTLIELLVVVALIALLVIALMLALIKQLGRGRDAQRKADLEKIKISFEDYYNDNGCYPDVGVLKDCGGSNFSPYLDVIPCDPISKKPYYYVPLAGDTCGGYRLYTSLETTDDPIIEALNCDGPNGCGYGSEYNYGVSVGTTVLSSDGVVASPVPTLNPSPSPSTTIYEYACDSAGTCNRFEKGHPFLSGCPKTWDVPGCDSQCSNPIYWCN